jgi:hypothetical protein
LSAVNRHLVNLRALGSRQQVTLSAVNRHLVNLRALGSRQQVTFSAVNGRGEVIEIV